MNSHTTPSNAWVPADMTPQGGADLGASIVGRAMIAQPQTETEWLMMDVPGIPQPQETPEDQKLKAETILDSLVELIVDEVGQERADEIMEAMMLVHGQNYSLRKAAELLGCSKSHVHNLVTQGARIMKGDPPK